jgi:hypothetical protein
MFQKNGGTGQTNLLGFAHGLVFRDGCFDTTLFNPPDAIALSAASSMAISWWSSGSNRAWLVYSNATTGNNSLIFGNSITQLSGSLGIGQAPNSTVDINGSLATFENTIKTTNYTVAATDSALIFNGAGTITLTLPAASSFPGRWLYVKTIAAFSLVSASANVKPIGSNTAGTAILGPLAGKAALLQSDGTNWVVIDTNVVVNVQTFTANGTYTPTAGMQFAIVEAIGAGGGGGSITGSATVTAFAGGGGAGGYSRALLTAAQVVTDGGSDFVTVGTHGNGGASGAVNNGGAGGNSGVSSAAGLTGTLRCQANGGGAGAGSNGSSTLGTASSGGTVGTGNIVAGVGQAGGFCGFLSAGEPITGGIGGSTQWGGGGVSAVASGSAQAGGAATGKGSGGAGACANNVASNAAGGNGADGYVVITEYC